MPLPQPLQVQIAHFTITLCLLKLGSVATLYLLINFASELQIFSPLFEHRVQAGEALTDIFIFVSKEAAERREAVSSDILGEVRGEGWPTYILQVFKISLERGPELVLLGRVGEVFLVVFQIGAEVEFGLIEA